MIEVEKAQDKQTVKKEKVEQKQVDKNEICWQFKYRNYREILGFVDARASATQTGVKPNYCVRARNWRLYLDLDDQNDKKVHDGLMKSTQKDVSFWQLKDREKADGIKDRAQTLAKLLEMPEAQLMGMLDHDDLQNAGLSEGHPSKIELVMAIIDGKKFAIGEKE